MQITITIKIEAEQKPTKSLVQIWGENLNNWIKAEELNNLL